MAEYTFEDYVEDHLPEKTTPEKRKAREVLLSADFTEEQKKALAILLYDVSLSWY